MDLLTPAADVVDEALRRFPQLSDAPVEVLIHRGQPHWSGACSDVRSEPGAITLQEASQLTCSSCAAAVVYPRPWLLTLQSLTAMERTLERATPGSWQAVTVLGRALHQATSRHEPGWGEDPFHPAFRQVVHAAHAHHVAADGPLLQPVAVRAALVADLLGSAHLHTGDPAWQQVMLEVVQGADPAEVATRLADEVVLGRQDDWTARHASRITPALRSALGEPDPQTVLAHLPALDPHVLTQGGALSPLRLLQPALHLTGSTLSALVAVPRPLLPEVAMLVRRHRELPLIPDGFTRSGAHTALSLLESGMGLPEAVQAAAAVTAGPPA